jgi:hypothetical protein
MGRSLAPLQALGHRASRQRATPFEDDDEDDCEAPGEPASVNRQKIFVWQSYRITVFLKHHREYELNPNPFRKA